jgi:hypothetical protein
MDFSPSDDVREFTAAPARYAPQTSIVARAVQKNLMNDDRTGFSPCAIRSACKSPTKTITGALPIGTRSTCVHTFISATA